MATSAVNAQELKEKHENEEFIPGDNIAQFYIYVSRFYCPQAIEDMTLTLRTPFDYLSSAWRYVATAKLPFADLVVLIDSLLLPFFALTCYDRTLRHLQLIVPYTIALVLRSDPGKLGWFAYHPPALAIALSAVAYSTSLPPLPHLPS